MIKAIETRFDGYRFRSRLEARWATFFKHLEIPYEYEKEGYILDGTPYLPDFWLPEQKSFVEIKGQEPTEEELRKFKLLSIYTEKDAALISGNIGIPGGNYMHDIQVTTYPYLYKLQLDINQRPIQREFIHASPEILSILQRIEEVSLRLRVEGETLHIVQNSTSYLASSAHRLAALALKQHQVLTGIQPLLDQYEDDLIQTLAVDDGWIIYFQELRGAEGIEWTECDQCGSIDMAASDFSHYGCPEEHPGQLHNDSPRLLEAYTAARSARFER